MVKLVGVAWGAFKVWNYHNIVAPIAIYYCTWDISREITIFRLRNVDIYSNYCITAQNIVLIVQILKTPLPTCTDDLLIVRSVNIHPFQFHSNSKEEFLFEMESSLKFRKMLHAHLPKLCLFGNHFHFNVFRSKL